MTLPTPDECREKAAEELGKAQQMSGDWGNKHALTAIGYIMLADSQPKPEPHDPAHQ